MAAVVAVNAEEAEVEDSAFEKAAQLALDEARGWAAALMGAGEERFEPCGDDLIEQGLVGPAGFVVGRGDASVLAEASGTGSAASKSR